MITLNELLASYKIKHGDTWAMAVLNRFLYLKGYTLSLGPNDEEERLLLWRWLEDMVAAGVRATEGQ